MRRHPQWRKRLERMLDQVERNRFAYGPDDCGPGWAGAGIVAVLDIDPAAPFRGRYQTAQGALRLVRKSGHANLADLLRALLQEATGEDCEIHPADARLGDLMAVPDDTAFGFLLGICNGERILVRRPEGKGTMERTAATAPGGWAMLKRLVLALALSTALVSANIERAQAGPAIAAVAAFAATPLGGIVTNLVIGIGASYVGTLVKQFFAPKSPGTASAAGIRGTVAAGGDVPVSFIMGDRMTAGSYAYRGTWGNAGKTPNAYYVEERILSDLPVGHLTGMWLGDQKVTIDWEALPTLQGYPILELRVDGKDHGWARFHDGTQTVADPYMVAKFAGHPDHPYSVDMVGRGQAKVITTFLVNRDLFKSWPKLKFETDGIRLYDISRDSTAGGFGPQRLNDPSTWQPSNLLPVQIYNCLMGVRYGGGWFWGGQNINPVHQLPPSTWIAAIAEARATVALAAGGTEAQYRGGFEITGDMEPQAVIKELLKGCAGRIAEIGGIYKMICGVPSSSVFSFTDDDILVTREQGYDPYPVLDQTHNAIRATYPEPAAGWAYKDAPARFSPDLEVADRGRQLAIDVRYEAVNSGTQVQRLMKAAIEEARRFRRHSHALPPEASELEPLDVVSWTSKANGYTAKKFIITDMDDEPTYLAAVNLQEIDPADYDFDPETDELPYTVGELGTSRPTPQMMTGWQAVPATMVDPDGVGWLPTIKVAFDGELGDVRAVRIQVREAWEDKLLVFDGEAPYDATVVAPTVTLNASFLRAKAYEARGIYLPFSTRTTRWSNQDVDGTDGPWLGVITPNVSPLPPGSVGSVDLARNLRDAVGFVLDGGLDSLEARILTQLDKLAGAQTTQTMASDRDRKVISSVVGQVQAAVVEEALTRATEDSALSQKILEVAAQAASGLAEGLFTVRAEVAPSGVLVRLAMLARVTTLDDYVDTGILIDLVSDGGGGFVSRILMKADSIYFTDGETTTIPMVFEDGRLKLNIADIGTVVAGLLRDQTDTYRFDIANGRFYRMDGLFDIDAKNRRIRIRRLV